MRIRILDLDGSIKEQASLKDRYSHVEHDLRTWGPRVRMACRRGRFARFERVLEEHLSAEAGAEPDVTLYGSGDFHHVSLALVRRIQQPFNLLVLDKHPDWMRAIPFLHCGTWLYHAARLPLVRRIFHVGGDLDFDNAFRWLAPWRPLRSGKIAVMPAIRTFERGRWSDIVNEPVRPHADLWTDPDRLEALLDPFRADLMRWPLYVSLDKDVMSQADAVVNWDSGYLALPEVEMILEAFLGAARGKLVGMDIVGDWSPIHLRGVLRHFLHLTEHPRLVVDPQRAVEKNSRTNLVILHSLRRQMERLRGMPVRVAA
jgi:arginase family enzyme